MKKNKVMVWMAVFLILIGTGAYIMLDRYLGNNVEIDSVMASTEKTDTSDEAGETSENKYTAVSTDELDGIWNIASGSKVYWSVTTSKETVNFVNEAVTGSWSVNLNDVSTMSGEGVVDMTKLDSGNSQRDSHVKERDDLLTVDQYPQATFEAKSFTSLPMEWEAGSAVPLEITGTMTVKGKEKEVVFAATAMYQDGQLLLSGTTIVTFADFGMTSPHTIVLETENELTVQLELVMNKS